MRKKAIIGSAAAGALAGVALVVFTRGGDKVVSRLRQPADGDGRDLLDSPGAGSRSGALDVDRRVAEVANGTVPEVVAKISTLSDIELHRLRAHERAHKNRVSVLRAIDRALA